MRKKGKSYQKVPPYKRYGASKPVNRQQKVETIF